MKEHDMVQPTYADRYAEAGLTATGQMITDRIESIKRIVAIALKTTTKILDLVGVYYESPDVDPSSDSR